MKYHIYNIYIYIKVIREKTKAFFLIEIINPIII